MTNAIFVAGTDTEVGKTVVSKALLQALAAKKLQTIGYKPVAAGCEETEEGRFNSDALHLQSAATLTVDYADVNPYALMMPASPHIAAKRENVVIEKSILSGKLEQHKNRADMVLVEGAGGWRVPISDSDYLSSWVKQENLPVVLVVGIKLGCLNHAVLTAEAIKADGLNLVGWVANRINPGIENYSEMIKLLEAQMGAPKLGEIPYLPQAKKREMSKFVNVDPLIPLVK